MFTVEKNTDKQKEEIKRSHYPHLKIPLINFLIYYPFRFVSMFRLDHTVHVLQYDFSLF